MSREAEALRRKSEMHRLRAEHHAEQQAKHMELAEEYAKLSDKLGGADLHTEGPPHAYAAAMASQESSDPDRSP